MKRRIIIGKETTVRFAATDSFSVTEIRIRDYVPSLSTPLRRRENYFRQGKKPLRRKYHIPSHSSPRPILHALASSRSRRERGEDLVQLMFVPQRSIMHLIAFELLCEWSIDHCLTSEITTILTHTFYFACKADSTLVASRSQACCDSQFLNWHFRLAVATNLRSTYN